MPAVCHDAEQPVGAEIADRARVAAAGAVVAEQHEPPGRYDGLAERPCHLVRHRIAGDRGGALDGEAGVGLGHDDHLSPSHTVSPDPSHEDPVTGPEGRLHARPLHSYHEKSATEGGAEEDGGGETGGEGEVGEHGPA
jgi:hypothetical protein